MEQSTKIVVSNMEYKIKSDVDSNMLERSVAELNSCISRYKKNAQYDELRATVISAVVISIEKHQLQSQMEELERTLKSYRETISKLHTVIDESLSID